MQQAQLLEKALRCRWSCLRHEKKFTAYKHEPKVVKAMVNVKCQLYANQSKETFTNSLPIHIKLIIMGYLSMKKCLIEHGMTFNSMRTQNLREQHWNIYITICKVDIQWLVDIWHREPKPVLWDNLEGWRGQAGGRGDQQGGDTCRSMADSCWCMAKPIIL